MIFLLAAILLGSAGGCTSAGTPVGGRPFVLGKDSFAFTNEMVWTYQFTSNGLVTHKVNPPPEFPHRCFPMARAAREIFYNARFDPAQPKAQAREYKKLARKIISRSSRRVSNSEDRIVIPGYDSLFAFSAEHGPLLRELCGGQWLSYFQRGNWRMIFPITDRKERKTAKQLKNEIERGLLPIVHIYSFPNLKVNHAILLFGVDPGPNPVFHAYDPNNPSRAADLRFDEGADAFFFERNQYFEGGSVSVYEVYHGWFH